MEHEEVAVRLRAHRSVVQHLGPPHLNTALAAKPEAKAEIDILDIPEETLVESAGRCECLTRIERCGGARRKYLAIVRWERGYRPA